MSPGRVDGKVVVVTGAAGGQGAAEVALLAAEGAHVVAADVADPSALEGERIEPFRLDVADEAGWAALAGHLRERHGRVDGLVNNAGVAHRARLLDVQRSDWDRVLAVNVTGAMLGMQALAPLMPRGGSIVNVGSAAALTGHYTAAYTASKWALRGLSRLASLELGERGIRVNAIHPGYVDTPMTATASPAFLAASFEVSSLGRVGEPEEIAPLVLFLVSDESSYITGADIPIDGGQTGHGGAKALSDAVRRA